MSSIRFVSKQEREKRLKEEKSFGDLSKKSIEPNQKSHAKLLRKDIDSSTTNTDNWRIPDKKRRNFKFEFDWNPSEDTTTASPNIPIVPRRKQRRIHDTAITSDQEHWSKKQLVEMTNRDWRIFNEDFRISCSGGSVPKPVRYWREAGLHPLIHATLEQQGYDEPTPVQRQSIPLSLASRDFVAISETGSGKTAAFVIPLIMKIVSQKQDMLNISENSNGPSALVLAPTRELALQINEEIQKFALPFGIQSHTVIGGHSYSSQEQQFRNGSDIIVATPGRLVASLEMRFIVLNSCRFVVLDEADKMIDMGFEEQVSTILQLLPDSNTSSTTMAMFSATMPPAIQRISANYLKNPAFLSIGSKTGPSAPNISYREIFLEEIKKQHELTNLLKKDSNSTIIFVNSKKKCDSLNTFLGRSGYRNISVLHGGRSQSNREDALANFRIGRTNILIATDVACRGIDIKGVTVVINYDMPSSIESFVHRAGRTGRMGGKGVCISFITPEDSHIFSDYASFVNNSGADVPKQLKQYLSNAESWIPE